ncbi:MAG: winged helix DNA-binding domain-containing protein [Solirubrobacteraceae bacterium]
MSIRPALLRRLRLAAQRLTPETAASSAEEAARAVCGIQAQDVRAAGLALRCRVPGITRADVDGARLVRTWTVRGTVHLVAEGDRPWLHALCAPRYGPRFEAMLAKRGGLEIARDMLGPMVGVLEENPRDRASLLSELASRGQPDIGPYAVNVLIPWAAQQGVVVGLADGRLRAADPPPPVDPDEALATMARRYLAGYGPASAADLASWSGLPVGLARRGLAALGPLDRLDDLLALPGTLDEEPPVAPAVRLLPSFDTTMLGYRTREPLLAAEHDKRILPGGGILRPVVLARGVVRATWRLAGAGRRRRLELEWFGRPGAARPVATEARDVGRFLGLAVELV